MHRRNEHRRNEHRRRVGRGLVLYQPTQHDVGPHLRLRRRIGLDSFDLLFGCPMPRHLESVTAHVEPVDVFRTSCKSIAQLIDGCLCCECGHVCVDVVAWSVINEFNNGIFSLFEYSIFLVSPPIYIIYQFVFFSSGFSLIFLSNSSLPPKTGCTYFSVCF